MGVERAVTRWYLQRQQILQEIATLKAELRTIEEQQKESSESSTSQGAEERLQHLATAQLKLRELGSCPRPMMG